MKLKLLLVFTICAMVSTAQSKSGSNTTTNTDLTVTTEDNFAVTTLNETINFDDEIKLYPTVTEDLIYFGIKDDKTYKFTITVYDIYGKKQNAEIHKGTINISDLEPGIYIVRFTCKKFSVTKNAVRK